MITKAKAMQLRDKGYYVRRSHNHYYETYEKLKAHNKAKNPYLIRKNNQNERNVI